MIKNYNKLCETIKSVPDNKRSSSYFKEILSKKFSYDTILADSNYGKMIIKFLSFESTLLLYLNNVKFDSSSGNGQVDLISISSLITKKYASLPVSILDLIPE